MEKAFDLYPEIRTVVLVHSYDIAGKFDEIKAAGIPFGIGGMDKFDAGFLPRPEAILVEHYKLGSTGIIISRFFCNDHKIGNLE